MRGSPLKAMMPISELVTPCTRPASTSLTASPVDLDVDVLHVAAGLGQ